MDALLLKRQEGVIKALRAKEALLSDTVSALRLQREEEQEELRAEVASLKASLASVRGEYALKFADAVTTPAEEWELAKEALAKLQTGESSVEVRVDAVRWRQQALTCTCCTRMVLCLAFLQATRAVLRDSACRPDAALVQGACQWLTCECIVVWCGQAWPNSTRQCSKPTPTIGATTRRRCDRGRA